MTIMDELGYVDGTVTPLAEAKVPLTDRGYLLGDGIFETLRVSSGRVFRRNSHVDRLKQGLKVLGMADGLTTEFDAAVDTLLEQAETHGLGDDLYLRVNLTTGPMQDIAGDGRAVSVTGSCKRFRPYPMKHYADGIRLVLAKQRKDPGDPLSTIKHLGFLPYVAARRHAMSQAAHDAVLLNTVGDVAECTTSNLFAVDAGVVHAPGPDEGALPGVTRDAVLELLQDTGLPVQTALAMETLQKASEVFVTNTTGGIVPVTRINDQAVGDGNKGELTTKLGTSLEAMIRGR